MNRIYIYIYPPIWSNMACRKISHLWDDFPSELNLSSGNFQPFQAGFQDAIHFGSGFWLTDSDLMTYPLVNCPITMENHHFLWENPLFLWSFSIAMLNYQRVSSPYHAGNIYQHVSSNELSVGTYDSWPGHYASVSHFCIIYSIIAKLILHQHPKIFFQTILAPNSTLWLWNIVMGKKHISRLLTQWFTH